MRRDYDVAIPDKLIDFFKMLSATIFLLTKPGILSDKTVIFYLSISPTRFVFIFHLEFYPKLILTKVAF